jgi:hypothetical protein
MGRPLRIKVPDFTYHITSRTNECRVFFKARKACSCVRRDRALVYFEYGITPYAD